MTKDLRQLASKMLAVVAAAGGITALISLSIMSNSTQQSCPVNGNDNVVSCTQSEGSHLPATALAPSGTSEQQQSAKTQTQVAAARPVDYLQTYCAQWGRVPVLRVPTTAGWRCASSGAEDQDVSIDDICQMIYSSQSKARAAQADDPRSWYCT